MNFGVYREKLNVGSFSILCLCTGYRCFCVCTTVLRLILLKRYHVSYESRSALDVYSFIRAKYTAADRCAWISTRTCSAYIDYATHLTGSCSREHLVRRVADMQATEREYRRTLSSVTGRVSIGYCGRGDWATKTGPGAAAEQLRVTDRSIDYRRLWVSAPRCFARSSVSILRLSWMYDHWCRQ